MGLVHIKDPITNIEYEYYLDDVLKKPLDEKVRSALQKKDDDYIICIDGKERQGKSVLGMQIGKYIDPSLSLDRVCFSSDEFRNAVLNAKKNQCVIFDEAYRGYGSSSALSEVNKILRSMMMEMGQKNLFVIIILPTFYLLEKYVALWRTKILIHISKRSYFRCFNTRKKQQLYLNPIGKRFYTYKHVRTTSRGRFYGKYVVDEAEYRKKKSLSFQEEFTTTKNDKFKEQRDNLIRYIYKKYKLSIRKLSKEISEYNVHLKSTAIDGILAKK